MKKKWILGISAVIIFGAGITLGNTLPPFFRKQQENPHVTGIGGIFFKCKSPKALRAWYQEHLGIATNPYGAVFEWYQGADSTQKGFLQWSPFSEKTTYFGSGNQTLMINYRVNNLNGLLHTLAAKGIHPVDTLATYDYGKFIHIEDLEGNRIELWEPNDAVYEKMGSTMGYSTVK